jgi:magnesium-transporting ATPase (P-type)
MCGDGANDVAALGAADVGVALLSGFGLQNVNATTAASPSLSSDTPPAVNQGGETETDSSTKENPARRTRVAEVAKQAQTEVETQQTMEVRIGDASTAAPFTARRPSIASVADLIRFALIKTFDSICSYHLSISLRTHLFLTVRYDTISQTWTRRASTTA